MRLLCVGGDADGIQVDINQDRETIKVVSTKKRNLDMGLYISSPYESYTVYKKMEFIGKNRSFFVLVPYSENADFALSCLIRGHQK